MNQPVNKDKHLADEFHVENNGLHNYIIAYVASIELTGLDPKLCKN